MADRNPSPAFIRQAHRVAVSLCCIVIVLFIAMFSTACSPVPADSSAGSGLVAAATLPPSSSAAMTEQPVSPTPVPPTPSPTPMPSPSSMPTATSSPSLSATPSPSPKVQPAPTPKPVTVKLKITFSKAAITRDGRIGNTWSTAVSANKKAIGKGRSISLTMKSTDELTIVCTAKEADKKPDIGTETLAIAINKLKRGNNTFTVDVPVMENGGRNINHVTTWRFMIIINRS